MSPELKSVYNENEKIAWLRLIRTPKIGRNTFFSLLSQFGTATKAIEGLNDYSEKLGLKNIPKICSKDSILKEIEQCEKLGAKIITFADPEYPYRLKEIQDPPVAITVRGNVEAITKDGVGIVGSRNASTNGCRFTHLIAEELSNNNITTISGMARGIDTQAHIGSLKNGTVAVLAGGVDHIYPRENEKLYYDIIKNDGAIVSEMHLGCVPKASFFPQRNRIISGLSWGLVVIEASLRSGTLITARFANEQGREVFALPGSPFDERNKGCNKLIKDGATLIESAKDIIHDIQYLIAEQEYIFKEEKQNNKPLLFTEDCNQQFFEGDSETQNIREILLKIIDSNPKPIDEIIRQTGFSAQVINIALMQLELQGQAEVKYGKVERLYTSQDFMSDNQPSLFEGKGEMF